MSYMGGSEMIQLKIDMAHGCQIIAIINNMDGCTQFYVQDNNK